MVFLSKLGDLQKKRSSPKFKGFFRPKSEIQGFFSGRILVISKQQKKRSSPKFKGFFWPKLEIPGFVSGRNQKLKSFFRPNAGYLKKKKVSTEIQTSFSGRNQKLKDFFRPNAGYLKKKGLHRNSNGFFRPKSEIQGFFLAECR